jgi:hypothetical protein
LRLAETRQKNSGHVVGAVAVLDARLAALAVFKGSEWSRQSMKMLEGHRR